MWSLIEKSHVFIPFVPQKKSRNGLVLCFHALQHLAPETPPFGVEPKWNLFFLHFRPKDCDRARRGVWNRSWSFLLPNSTATQRSKATFWFLGVQKWLSVQWLSLFLWLLCKSLKNAAQNSPRLKPDHAFHSHYVTMSRKPSSRLESTISILDPVLLDSLHSIPKDPTLHQSIAWKTMANVFQQNTRIINCTSWQSRPRSSPASPQNDYTSPAALAPVSQGQSHPARRPAEEWGEG